MNAGRFARLAETDRATVNFFVDGKAIGGYAELVELDMAGELKTPKTTSNA